MTDIAQVCETKATGFHDEDRVQAPLAALYVVVEGGQSRNAQILLGVRDSVPAGTSGLEATQNHRRAGESVCTIVIPMFCDPHVRGSL
ncbi:MAG: hypothetical protein VB959_19305 [Rhodospirillales bacterium]